MSSEYEDVPGHPLKKLRCPNCGNISPGMAKTDKHRVWSCDWCTYDWYIENIQAATSVELAKEEGKNNSSKKPRRVVGNKLPTSNDHPPEPSDGEDEKLFRESDEVA